MVALMRNQNGQEIIQPNIPQQHEFGKSDKLCSKIHFKLRSNFNLPGDLNKK